MDYDEYRDFIDGLIELVKDLPIGCEALEGYIASDDIHSDFERFIEQTKLNNS